MERTVGGKKAKPVHSCTERCVHSRIIRLLPRFPKDIAKELIADGLLCLESRREKMLQKLVTISIEQSYLPSRVANRCHHVLTATGG